MTKLAYVALALAACADQSSSMNSGSDAGDTDADPAARTWTFSSFANGQKPKYAVSPSGTLAVVTNDDVGVLRIYFSDGSSLGSPNGPQANHEGVYGIGFDATSSLHLFFRTWGHTTIDHWVYRAQAWHALPSLGDMQLEIANGPRGELYALAKTISGSLAELSFLTFGADEIATEPLWTIGASDPIAFAVGRDGNPALAWGKADADGYPQYAHRGSTGWRQTQLGTERMRLPRFAIAAADLATVFIHTTDGRYLSQQTFTAWAEPVRTAHSPLSATTDAFGIIHTCSGDDHGQLAHGMLAVTPLNDGGWDCWLATDAAGRVHLAFHIGNVIKRAVYE